MKTNSNAPQTLYLGLDVHKAETVIAILESDRDAEPRHYGSIATTQHALERTMRRIAKSQERELSDLHVCYEASGCGFWIARRLLQMGIRCDVIAPSLIPVKSGDRIKTDKRDAMKLAKNLRSNDLVAVNIPDSTDEAIRDLCRGRTDAVDDLRRAKTRLLALLRRLGYNYGGKTHWTEAHKRYLRDLRLPDAAHNRVLEDNLTTIDFHHKRIAKLEEAMLQLLEDWQRKPLVDAMMAFKGFKLVAAMVTVSEPSGARETEASATCFEEVRPEGSIKLEPSAALNTPRNSWPSLASFPVKTPVGQVDDKAGSPNVATLMLVGSSSNKLLITVSHPRSVLSFPNDKKEVPAGSKNFPGELKPVSVTDLTPSKNDNFITTKSKSQWPVN